MPINVQLSDFKPFQADSLSWGTRHAPSAGLPGAQAQVSDCVLTKDPDDNSAQLQRYLIEGRRIAKAELTMRGDESSLRVTLTEVLIAAYSTSTGEKPTETIALNFDKVEYDYKG